MVRADGEGEKLVIFRKYQTILYDHKFPFLSVFR